MKQLKIHFLTPNVIECGTYFRYHNLAIALTNLGQKVTVFSAEPRTEVPPKEELRDGVLYKIVPYDRLNSLKRCFIDYPPCDVAHLFQPFLSSALVWQWVMPKKAKVLFYDWDDLWIGGLFTEKFLESPRSIWRHLTIGQIEKNFPKKATHVTTLSHSLSDMAYQRKAKKVTIIYNGIWPFPLSDKQLLREKLGLDKNALYVGFMGRTAQDLSWCFEALKENLHRDEKLRFALCGPPSDVLDGVDSQVLQRVDYLGSIPQSLSRDFAQALDIGLLPLKDNVWNRSRLPIKFTDYLAAGTPVLYSDIGECGLLAKNFPFVVNGGKTYNEFSASFGQAVTLIQNNSLPKVDREKVEQLLSWNLIAEKLLETYYQELGR